MAGISVGVTTPPNATELFASRAQYERERDWYWTATPIVIGRIDELPDVARYFTWEMTGVPLLVVRSADGQARAFYNSCRHRGAPVVREPRGRNRALRCQYHSWTYDTFGRLVSVPDERDFVDLRMEERSLVPVACHVIEGWLVANSAPAAGWLPPGDGLRVLTRVTHRVAANWKFVGPAIAPTIGAAATPMAPAGAWTRAGDDLAIITAWPGGPSETSLEALLCAPDWGAGESPLQTPRYEALVRTLEAAMASAAAPLEAQHAAILAARAEPSEAVRTLVDDVTNVIAARAPEV